MDIYDYEGNPLNIGGSSIISFMRGVNHRGYCTVAPENTLPAYALSYQYGFKYVETDVSFTSDNVAVLLHDSTIDRTSDGTGSISSMTFEEVREYDFGSWKSSEYAGTPIPSLAEFLVLCRNLGLHPYIELKKNGSYTDAQIQGVVDMVEAYGMKRNVSYISFTNSYLAAIAEYAPSARLGYVVSSVSSTTISQAVALRTGENEVFLDSSSYGSSVIELCQEAALPLEVWTIDNGNTIRNLNDYISGVTSNSEDASVIKRAKTISQFE